MYLAHVRSVPILIATLAIGAGRVEAQDWEPQPPQGTYRQVPGFSSFYIQPVSGSPSAVDGVFSPASLGTFTANVMNATGPLTATTLKVTLKQKQVHHNAYGTPETPAPFEYEILYGKTGLEKPLCGPNYNWALAIPGRYSKDGLYHPGPEVSFACIPYLTGTTLASGYQPRSGGGVAAKCIDWGYPPWPFKASPKPLPWVGTTLTGKPLPLKDANAYDIHQACLYMATADYCGNGNPHTVDGTWIEQFNDVTIKKVVTIPAQHLPPIVPATHFTAKLSFEAAWRPPVFSGDERKRILTRPGGALCVTKARWAALPLDLGTSCPSLEVHTAERKRAPFCETYTEKDLENLGALLVSYSPLVDVGLYRCRTPTTSTTPSLSVTTIADDLDTPNKSPPVTYNFKKDNSFTCSDNDFQGAVLRPIAASLPLPEGFPPWSGSTTPVPLYLQDWGGGRYRTDTTPGSGASTLIGYVLPAAAGCPGSTWCGKELKLNERVDGSGIKWSLTTTSTPTSDFTSPPTSLGFLINL